MKSKRRIDPPHALRLEEFPRLQLGLVLLGQAYQAAREAGADVWEFSIDAGSVRQSGLTRMNLQWLVRHNYVACRKGRAYSGTMKQVRRYVATKAGAALARQLLTATEHIAKLADAENLQFGLRPAGSVPHWDPVCRELRIGRVIIRRFRRSAPNQELILSRFQEYEWRRRIEDPLPPKEEIHPAARLHDAIKFLNRGLRPALIRFSGDGTGTGVVWSRTVRSRSTP